MLTAAGERTLESLGQYLRSIVKFPSDNYNSSFLYTRSTDIPRTLQSADALLRGAFPNMSAMYPIIYTIPQEEDDFLLADNIPALVIPYRHDAAQIHSSLASLIKASINTSDVLAISAELFLDGLCGNASTGLLTASLTQCLLTAEDIGAYLESEGLLGKYPVLSRYYGNLLTQLRQLLNKEVLEYDTNQTTDLQTGPMMQKLLAQLVSNMESAANNTFSTSVVEYSAHDSTITALASAMGNNGDVFLRPPFGSAMVFQLLVNENGRSKDFYLQASFAATQSATDLNYNMTPIGIWCLDMDAPTYHADGRCQLQYFQKYAATRKAQSPDGLCYLSGDILSWMQCTDVSVVPTNKLCQFYRRQCPKQGCPSESYLVLPELKCVPTSNGVDLSTESGYFLLSGIVGLVIGILVVACWPKCPANSTTWIRKRSGVN